MDLTPDGRISDASPNGDGGGPQGILFNLPTPAAPRPFGNPPTEPGSVEGPFTLTVNIRMDCFGIPAEHAPKIIARITREVELFGVGRAHVEGDWSV